MTTNTNYNYMEAMKEDIKNYIDNEVTLSDFSDRDELEDYLNETLWIEDSITGNASGSYYCNTWEAEEALCHNLNLLQEACEEFGCDMGETVKKGAENCDVTIRCYLLGQAITEVLDNMGNELEKTFCDVKENGGINMVNIDMWYGDDHKEADKIDITFYPNDGEYRGNIYKGGKIIGDYVCNDSVELEKSFPQLAFSGD